MVSSVHGDLHNNTATVCPRRKDSTAGMGKRKKPKKAGTHGGGGSGAGGGGGGGAAASGLPSKLTLSMLQTGLMSAADTEKAIAAIQQKPIDVSHFMKAVEQRRKYPVLLRVEWQLLLKVDTHSTRHATKPANEVKNSNKRIVPYDYNRVVLDPLPGIPDSDYVNASYIDSILKPNAYIVAQGPNDNTVADFWRLVWQERPPCIIMLTKTFDFIKVMCTQYWPNVVERTERYGDIQICVLEQESLASFVIRTIRMTRNGESRSILQFHFTEWPCHSVPFTAALLEFRRRVRQYLTTAQSTGQGPALIHCSDGGGRTGTYIAIDSNLELSTEDNKFEVFSFIKRLRSARRGMLESIEQYRFVYEVLEEAVRCGSTWFPVNEISARLKYKSTKNPVNGRNDYQTEFDQICKMTPKFTIGDCAGGHRQENRDKNRDVIVVPPDNYRPYLSSFQGNDCTDYINAVFVDGYTRPKEYIVTEWPMKSTVPDIWSLIYDHDCNSVLVLDSPGENPMYPSFWPETGRTRKYGAVFTIELVSCNHYTKIKSWIFKINKKVVSLTELMAGVKAEPKTVQFFQLTCWPMGHKVPTSTNALVELMNMVDRWRQRTNYGPVLCVSYNGCGRVGVYCAASAAIEQVIQHQEVDVFQAVKTVRRHRPQLVENMTEYKYCYDLVLHYVLHYLHKE